MTAPDTVRAYKGLSAVERAFRSLKSVDLKVRPVFHRTDERVRAHVLLCMLAYYVEWHMRRRLAPLLFDDEDRAAPRPHAPRSWHRPGGPNPPGESAPTKGGPCTASAPCCGTWLRSRRIGWCPACPVRSRMKHSPGPPNCSAKPSACSAYGYDSVPSDEPLEIGFYQEKQQDRSC